MVAWSAHFSATKPAGLSHKDLHILTRDPNAPHHNTRCCGTTRSTMRTFVSGDCHCRTYPSEQTTSLPFRTFKTVCQTFKKLSPCSVAYKKGTGVFLVQEPCLLQKCIWVCSQCQEPRPFLTTPSTQQCRRYDFRTRTSLLHSVGY